MHGIISYAYSVLVLYYNINEPSQITTNKHRVTIKYLDIVVVNIVYVIMIHEVVVGNMAN